MSEGKAAFQLLGSTQVFTLVENVELKRLRGEKLKELGLVAKLLGDSRPYSLEIEEYHR